MIEPVRMAVVGTGSIGVVHADRVSRSDEADLAVLCGLDPGAPALAERYGVPLVTDHRDVLDHDPQAVVVATPNALHAPMGRFFAEHGLPILVEKPLTDSVAAGLELCETAEKAGTPILTGQHRRHNPMAVRAKELIADRLGTPVSSSALVTMKKPDSYYEPEWRRGSAAGPLLVNLIHEVDLQRFVFDEIEAVQAASRRLVRPFDFDDTSAVILHFRNGAVGTVVLTESTPSPWSWEGSVAEGMGFHSSGRDYARYLGSEAALSLPSLTLWTYDAADGEPGWMSPIHSHRVDVVPADPYEREIAHFARVARGEEAPVVDGRDGLRSLAVVEAAIEAARTGGIVTVDSILNQT